MLNINHKDYSILKRSIAFYDDLYRKIQSLLSNAKILPGPLTKRRIKCYSLEIHSNDDLIELDYNEITGQSPITERLLVKSGELVFVAEYGYVPEAVLVEKDLSNDSSRLYYNGFTQMTWVGDPNVNQITYQYGDVGNLIQRTDAVNQMQLFEYGMVNRLLRSSMITSDVLFGKGSRGHYEYIYYYDESSLVLPIEQNFEGKLSRISVAHRHVPNELRCTETAVPRKTAPVGWKFKYIKREMAEVPAPSER